MSMGIKKILLGLGLSALVSAFGVSVANAGPAPVDDEARQECPAGQKCDRPAPDNKKARKPGDEQTNNASAEGREHAESMNRIDGDKAMPAGEGKKPRANDMKAHNGDDAASAPRDEQKQPKDPKKKPPKPVDDEDLAQ